MNPLLRPCFQCIPFKLGDNKYKNQRNLEFKLKKCITDK